jgi:flagellar motor switch/type III secretory pathway protein FliN
MLASNRRMSKLSLQIAEKLLDACRAGASEAAAALSAVLDGPLQIVNVKNRPQQSASAVAGELQGFGLAIVFHVGDQAAALLIPEVSRLIPAWCGAPDAAGEAKLQRLAQELSRVLLPTDLVCAKFTAGVVEHLGHAVSRGGPAETCGHLELAAKVHDLEVLLHLVWPLAHGDRLLETQLPGDPVAAFGDAAQVLPTANLDALLDEGLARLPNYSRSLLCISVPLVVTLAHTHRKVNDILKLGPGAIIQFEKSCEDTLELEAGGQKIAEGEAVKVGEKFGLRITAIRLPEERFRAVGT